MNISCLVIDDEPLARKRLTSLISKIPTLDLLGECGTGNDALKSISTLRPDLIFLDVQMKDMTGFDVLKKLDGRESPMVIFVTAYDEYALRAFDFYAFDYLLKPFKKERFERAVSRVSDHFHSSLDQSLSKRLDRLLKHLDTPPAKESDPQNHRIPIRSGRSISFVDLADVMYIMASGSYVDIHTTAKKFVHRSSLGRIVEESDEPRLIRVHRSSIVNIDFVQQLEHGANGEIELKMKDGMRIKVSKSYKHDIQSALGLR